MFYIGCHLSVSDGFEKMAQNALSLGANTLQFFTRNPRGSQAKDMKERDVFAFRAICEEKSFGSVVAHAPYTLNICSSTPDTRRIAGIIMKDDIERMERTPGNYYNFHPGSHTGLGIEEGIRLISEALREVLPEAKHTIVLLETMSGKGSEVGGKFEEIKEIIDQANAPKNLGVCLDTCHVWDAGYDIVNDLDGVITEFDRIIGLDRLKAIHLNDTKNPLASHKDRHEKIGEGNLGLEAISRIINHEALKNLPFVLETPNDEEGYKLEIELLKSLRK